MSDKTAALKDTEAFVRHVLRDRFQQRADAATIPAVAAKMAKAFPPQKAERKPKKELA